METGLYVPFDPRFHDAIREGRKRATCRNRRYGVPGCILKLPGGTAVLLWQERVTVSFVAEHLWALEGCESRAHFEAIWNELHPRAGFDPAAKVWLHIWSRFQPDPPASAPTEAQA